MGGVDRAVRSCDSGWLCSVGRREKRGSGLGARKGLSSLYPRHRAGAQEMGCQARGQQSEGPTGDRGEERVPAKA